jgi:hypothetical protein
VWISLWITFLGDCWAIPERFLRVATAGDSTRSREPAEIERRQIESDPLPTITGETDPTPDRPERRQLVKTP